MNLQKNDTIAIVAPAGFIKNKTAVNKAITLLKNWGFQVVLGKHVYKKHQHFAGTDAERLEDFQTFLDNPKVKAIWCARGGYGSIRIIDKLNFKNFKKHPKYIIGYSDICVFHQAVFHTNIPSIHSFMPTSMDTIQQAENAVLNFKNCLVGNKITYKIPVNKYNKTGKVKGKIIGGNLSILQSLAGTRFGLNQQQNYILFLEEIGEYKYHIDRMLQSLKLNGYFKNCIALLVGSFTNIPKNDPAFGESIEEIILNVTKDYDFPICFDFPSGHITNNQPIFFGKEVVLTIEKKSVNLEYL
ncbi:MAG TPA: LD-carboxypeptidase [Flavobacteriia bacterium]|nr:LD-carboxypeptidase [Flavobacteriia bacterium]